MNPVIPPLYTGSTGTNVLSLQQALLFMISRKLLTIQDNNLINEIRCCEMEKQYLGKATAELVRLFCEQRKLPVPAVEIVDSKIADMINKILKDTPLPKTVSGVVRFESGAICQEAIGMQIPIYQVRFRERRPLGEAIVDADGTFSFSYMDSADGADAGNTGLQASFNMWEQTLFSEVVYSYTDHTELELTIPEQMSYPPSEFEVLTDKLLKALDGASITEIDLKNEKELQQLSRITGEDIWLIVAMAQAAGLSADSIDTVFYYGLLRQNLPANRELLLQYPKGQLEDVLNIAIFNNIIPYYSSREQLAQWLQELPVKLIRQLTADPDKQGAKESATFYIINYILNAPDKTQFFLKCYFDFADSDFWSYLSRQDKFYDPFIPQLKAAMSVAILTNSNSAINNRVMAILAGKRVDGDPALPGANPAIPEPEQLTFFQVQDWYTIVSNAHRANPGRFFFPEDIIGDTDKEREQEFASRIYRNFSTAYPVASVNIQIERDQKTPFINLKSDLRTFRRNNPAFDVRTTSLVDLQEGGFNFEGVVKDPFIHEVATMQRLMVLTTDYATLAAFARDGLISSMHISRQEVSAFVDQYTDAVGSVRNAMSMHAAASSIVTYNMAKAFNLVPFELFRFDTINSDVPAVSANPFGKLPMEATALAAGATGTTAATVTAAAFATDPYAQWRTLFGALDSCNCTECQSIFSPSAYFVDLLQFIRSNLAPVYTELEKRRPDIKHIELSCPNTNVTLPHIDIVNELLEDLVSKSYYEAGNPYKMFARQTKAAASLQRTTPEYINSNGTTVSMQVPGGGAPIQEVIVSPYPVLQNAKYPNTLPYNYFKSQIDAHLDLAGVKGFELSQRFSDQERLRAWKDAGYCTEFLGLSKEQYQIITNGAPTAAEHMLAYGFKMAGSTLISIANPAIRGSQLSYSTSTAAPNYWQKVLSGRVDVFLQQTGLSYKDLLELLDCYCLNPQTGATSRKMAILKNDPSIPDDTCELDKLKIDGMDHSVLIRLFRFVRMKEVLGWSFYELDKALMALGAAHDNIASWDMTIDKFTGLAQIKYMANALGSTIEDTTALWKSIDLLPYRDYSRSEPEAIPSQYNRIFRNPVLSDLQASDYPFQEIPSAAGVAKSILVNYLSGILQLDGTGVSDLLESIFPGQSFIAADLSNLSKIYKEAVLLKGMQLSISEWLFFKRHIMDAAYYGGYPGASDPYMYNAAPFANTYDAIRFLSFASQAKQTGMPVNTMDYILRDKPTDQVSDDKHTTLLNKLLSDLRTGLKKNYYPAYTAADAAADTGSLTLQQMLQLVMDQTQASRLVSILEKAATPSGYTPEDDDFIDRDLRFLIPQGGAAKLTASADPAYIATMAARRAYVYDCLKVYVKTGILQPYAISFLGKELGIAPDILQFLLPLIKDTGNALYFDLLLDAAFIQSTESLDRWTTTLFKRQYRVVLVLEKLSILINHFGLDINDVQNLWGNGDGISYYGYGFDNDSLSLAGLEKALRDTAGGIHTPPSVVTFFSWSRFLGWVRIRSFTGEGMEQLYKFLNVVLQNAPPKEEGLNLVAAAFKMNIADMKVLLDKEIVPGISQGVFNLVYVEDAYIWPQTYQRIIDCLEVQHLLPAPMDTLHKIALGIRKACRVIPGSSVSVTQGDANEVIQVVKAQYSDDQWPEVVCPVNDRLRKERRDALLAYLLAYPPALYRYQWYSINDIYDTLMLDVEMSSCMLTTRVLLATNTIQLWVDRVQLGLEKYFNTATAQWELLQLTNTQSRQWDTWRRLYRVWEANRKIFIYPENWIEPELRDGKSPLFKDLEKFLDQNDLTAENVEDAYHTYLDRLDEIARLEVVGVFRERSRDYSDGFVSIPDPGFQYPNSDVLHVFGRSASKPHIYYYRKRVAEEWTAWEKMDVQIDGDHFVPVVWRGRLRFYWLVFTQDQPSGGTATALRSNEKYAMPEPTRWKIELAWTEYKNKAWTAKQIGKDPLFSFTVYEENPMSLDHIEWFSYPHNGVQRDWYFKGALEKQKKNIQFYSRVDNDGNLTFEVIERIVRNSGPQLNHLFSSNGYPFRSWAMNSRMNDAIAKIEASEYAPYRDVFSNLLGQFTARFDGITTSRSGPLDFNYNFFFDLYQNQPYKMDGYRFHYDKHADDGFTYYPEGGGNGMLLLRRAPDKEHGKKDGKYVVISKNLPNPYTNGNWSVSPKVDSPYFFYRDFDNSFFVEKVLVSRTIKKYIDPSFMNLSVNPPILSVNNGIINLNPSNNIVGVSSLKYPVFVTVKVPLYRFHNFMHDRVDRFKKILQTQGLNGLLNRQSIDSIPNELSPYFDQKYWPLGNVDPRFPINNVDFRNEGAYSLYNWELFFHIPMLIANKLSQSQRFDEARKWYHYVFNPTNRGDVSPAVFWNFSPFYWHATTAATATPQSVLIDPNLQQAINNWANNPFKPHLVARTRMSAYMKNAVMKYLDNLIAWGDMLFRTDTREAINEATLLYVLAAQLLGRRPETVPARAKHAVMTYNSLSSANLNAFSNALVQIESLLLPSGATTVNSVNNTPNPLATGSMFYFCLVPNSKLASYWDIIADRLFKIRNCRSIDGIERELALFAPPIDPALLVRAAAAGVSLADAIGDLNAPLPLYRFQVMSQKATELVQEVKGLGSELLAALEKKDAERLSLLRSGQELKLLEATTDIREQQLDESGKQIEALQEQQLMVQQRRDYYQGLLDRDLNVQEVAQLDLMQANVPFHIAQGATQALSSLLFAVPDATLGIFSTGISFGGSNLGSVMAAASAVSSTVVNVNSTLSGMAGIKAGYLRRKEEWQQQLKVADTELLQVDKQLIAAQIRKAIAENELRNHKLQVSNAREMDDAMRNKYTNEELYNWMSGQIAFTYFQSYKLAYDMAKRAERCYQNELSVQTSGFIQFGYWDSLRKGLLSGEQLSYDLKRMEASYLAENRREMELTKDVSMALFFPGKLQELKTGKSCEIELKEWMFDMDYPGQHLRRIKSVSLSIPCIAGPYTTISCKLSLLDSKYRISTAASAYDAPESMAYTFGNIQSIATSKAQNDSGMFELNFRDERYLPFERAGAISRWRIELPATYAQFDYNSISDVILHVHYTSRDSGALKQKAEEKLTGILFGSQANPLPRLFSLKHEFSNEWYAGFNSAVDLPGGQGGGKARPVNLALKRSMFPLFAGGKTITVTKLSFSLKPTVAGPNYMGVYYWQAGGSGGLKPFNLTNPSYAASVSVDPGELVIAPAADSVDLRLAIARNNSGNVLLDEKELSDWYMIVEYKLS